MLALPSTRAGATGITRDGDLLRLVRNVPGDAKALILEANQVYTWSEQGQAVFLLSGQVLIQQSVVQSRFNQAVGWLDLKRYKETGILRLHLYGEGQVRLDVSSDVQDGSRAVLDLSTRGEFRIRVGQGQVERQSRASEPIVERARKLGLGPTIQPVSLTAPVRDKEPARPIPTVAPMTSEPMPPPGIPGFSPVPPSPAPMESGGAIRQTRFEEPVPAPAGPADNRMVPAQAREPIQPPPTLGQPRATPSTIPPSPSATLPVPADPNGVVPARPERSVPIPLPPLPMPDNLRPQRQPPPSPAPRSPAEEKLPTPSESRRQPSPTPGLPAPTPIPPASPPSLPAPTPIPPAPLPPPSRPAAPSVPGQLPLQSNPGQPLLHRILPRSGKAPQLNIQEIDKDYRIITVTGGLILNVRNVPRIGVLDVEADRAVVWIRKGNAQQVADSLRSDQGVSSQELEFYMAGHVILRSTQNSGKDRLTLEAEELYYDARRNVAIALNARLETLTNPSGSLRTLTEPIILTTPQLLRTGPDTFEVREAELFSSKLPSDPGLKLLVANATVTNTTRPRTGWFGQPLYSRDGKPLMIQESIVRAKNVYATLEDVPFFYTPYLVADARDPLGPLETVDLGYNRIFDFQAGVGLNGYKLLGLQPIEGTRWRILLDYMSRRGPALGSNFSYNGQFQDWQYVEGWDRVIPSYNGLVRLYGIYDKSQDILGGSRPYLPFDPPGWRGRSLWRQSLFDLPEGFNVQSQVSLLSDRNFLEQYFKPEFDNEPNQANFLYVKQQQDQWAWSALGQVRTSNWITTTQWLPRLDGYLIGQDLFDRFTSNTQASLAYGQLRNSSDPPIPLQGVAVQPPGWPQAYDITTQTTSSARLALVEELSLPVHLGPVNLAPYAKGAVVGYSNDLQETESAQLWGGLGVRASLPLSRLYPELQSELFNVNGIYHKLVFGANYFYAQSTQSYLRYGEFDRLHDDASASALREITPYQPVLNPSAGFALATSPLFDPQRYAIRRLIDNRLDTLDNIQVVQLDLLQRWQTKRGFPGAEHIIDWMVLDTSISLFPQPTRDNFGKSFSFAEYYYLWNIGDRTSLESSGLYDPQDFGPRIFNIGMNFNRPDRTNVYIGYRQTDPLQSRMVMASISYTFSPKYSMTAVVAYDFGTTEALNNTVIFTRTGSDIQVSLGFTYNSLQNNFGAILEIVPSLLPINRRTNGMVSNMVTR